MLLRIALVVLTLLGNTRAGFRMVVLGDRTGNAEPLVFAQILEEIKFLRPDLLLNVGDLIEGYTASRETLEQQWHEVTSQLRRTGVNYRLTPGNHDISNALSESLFIQQAGATYYSFDRENCHFIVLDNSRWDSIQAFPAAQLMWLERDLAAHTAARWTFVSMHRSYWRAGRDTLHALFRRYGVDYVFSGHDHFYCSELRDGIQYIQVGPSGSRLKVYRDEARGAFQNYLFLEVGDFAVYPRVMRPGGLRAVDCVTTRDIALLDALEQQGVELTRIPIAPNRATNDTLRLTIRNLTPGILNLSGVWQLTAPNWRTQPETIALVANPGVQISQAYELKHAPGAPLYPLPRLSLAFTYDSTKHHELFRTLPIQRRAACPKTTAPVIDGVLNDRAWHRLPVLRDFGANEGGVALTDSLRVWLGHDDTMLYLAAQCFESQLDRLKCRAVTRDARLSDDDNINFLLCPSLWSGTTAEQDSAKVYYQLIVNPLGAIWDRKCVWRPRGSARDDKWNGNWLLMTGKGPNYWCLEAAIPLEELGLPAGTRPRSLGINIARYQTRTQAVAVYQAPFVHDPSQFAELQF